MAGTIRRIWYRAAGEVGTSRFFSTLHRTIYQLSGGQIFGRSMGCQVVLLTTTGRRTGEPHTSPVLGFVEGRAIIVVASNAGKDRHPSWYLNLRANPGAQVQVGREIRKARAREATPEERERLWPRLAREFGGYEVYRERTSRPIPVLILEPF